MKLTKKHIFISLAVIITVVCATAINESKKTSISTNSIVKEVEKVQKVYNQDIQNVNNNISEEEKQIRVVNTENALKEFEKLPVDTPYKTYDKLYEDIAEKYISKLPSGEYAKYFEILNTLEQRFIDNPNRQY